MSSQFALFLIIALPCLAAVVLSLILRGRLKEKGSISRSLNLELLLVRFPPPAPHAQGQAEPSLQQVREKIALMEQLYAQLHYVKDTWFRALILGEPAIALELTIPHIGEEISFYVAVPRRFASAVEKVIHGAFPEAHVEPSHDYNIFNPEGVSVGSSMVLRANPFYPFRSYQKLEGDPLRAITNVFTKLAKEGEGAALQIMARPANYKWQRMLKERSKKLQEGEKHEEDAFMRAMKTVTTVAQDAAKTEDKPKEMHRMTPLEEEMVRAMEAKAGKPLFEANIRLLASAPTRPRAEDILQSLETAFGQLNDPSLNGFRPARASGREEKNMFLNFSFRNFDEGKKVVVSPEELTSVFHFPNVALETPRLKSLKAREAPPPPNLPSDGLLLGYNLFRGVSSDIRLLDDDRRRHLYVIGQTGTGKTVFLKNLVQQDIEEGRGVCFIDPHGDTVEEILGLIPRHRFQDVIYFNPGDVSRPMGLNMLEYDQNFPEQKTFIVNELFGIFQKLYGAVPEALGPMFEQYFRNATMLVMDDPSSGNTLLEISRVMSDKPFRDLKISRAKNVVVRNFWTQIAEKAGGEGELRNMVPYITSKFDVFLANEIMRPVVTQERSAFNFRDVMDSGKILLVNLSKGRLGDINSSLIGLIIVGKLTMAALSRTDIEDQERRKDFYLYIDEFQNVTTDSIATIFAEARKYRLNLIVAHQYIKQLAEPIRNAVFGNVGSIAAFRIGSDDGEFMEKQFVPVFKSQDILNLDNYNCYIKLLLRGQTAPSFSMKTYPPKKGDREAAAIAKEISRTTYGRSRDEVEQEIIARSTTLPG